MKLAEEEATILAEEARSLAEAVGGARAQIYGRLAGAVDAGGLEEAELSEEAGAVAAMALETGRARAVHGPAGVRALTAVWKQSPQGQGAAHAADELNTALTSLRGLPLHDLTVAATGPGAYALTISAGPYEVRLVVDRAGVRLRSINVGGSGVGE